MGNTKPHFFLCSLMVRLCLWKGKHLWHSPSQFILYTRICNTEYFILFREVTVIRLISDHTIEEAMLRCAQEKLKLEKDITTDEGIKFMALFTPSLLVLNWLDICSLSSLKSVSFSYFHLFLCNNWRFNLIPVNDPVRSNLYSKVTFLTKVKWPGKTGDCLFMIGLSRL